MTDKTGKDSKYGVSGFPRVNLKVPYVQKGKASALGARWDKAAKTWYVPAGTNSAPFAAWIEGVEDPYEPNLKADYFFLGKAANACWKCEQMSDVFALFLPEGHQECEYEDEDDQTNENMIWVGGCGVASLSFVALVNPEVAAVLSAQAPGYTKDYSKTTDSHYLMNHCAHCKTSQGDFFLHNSPGAAFFPTCDEQYERVVLTPFQMPIQVHASAAWASIEYWKMRHEVGGNGFAPILGLGSAQDSGSES